MAEKVFSAASATLPVIHADGLILPADPHVTATPPGQRMEGYLEHILEKLTAILEEAVRRNLQVVILGDLFHWPRENSNQVLVRLIELFGEHGRKHLKPWCLVGNHDKYQARYTPDVSMAVLEVAGVLEVISTPGPQFLLQAHGRRLLVGASPDFSPLPERYEKGDKDEVLWITHHNIGFPDFEDKPLRIREVPGVDWMVNGHIHRPQPMQVKGNTHWVNPGGLVRMQFTRYSKERKPVAAVWTPECLEKGELELWQVPIRPFEEVFPDQALPEDNAGQVESESLFVQGLERLAWRRTKEGLGLKQFLGQNLKDTHDPESSAEERLVWKLYEEVVSGAENKH